MTQKLVECVPNISEGRDREKIDEIVAAAAAVGGVEVLDVDPGIETNRTVITLLGSPEVIAEGAFQLIRRASELIDMSKHQGAHARHGATDVCPFVPVSGVSMEDCVEIARGLGERVGSELNFPVFLYENAALRDERRSLADVRKGEYEALAEKLSDPNWAPDHGPAKFLPRTGVVTIGAREFLIAYNINLNTKNKSQANDLAMEIREKGRAVRVEQKTPYYSSGRLLRYSPASGIWPSAISTAVFATSDDLDKHYQEEGTTLAEELEFHGQAIGSIEGEFVMKRGRFEHCRAVGWVIPEYGRAQISINLTNFHVTNMHDVLEECRRMATKRGLVVTGSEVVGLVPFEAMREAGEYYLREQGSSAGAPVIDLMNTAVQSLGLADLGDFSIDKSVLGLPKVGGNLTSMGVSSFTDEVSRDSAAPGGGSIAALVGSLGAALAAMVCSITHGKKKYRKRRARMEEISIEAQRIKDQLIIAVDADTDAFNVVLEAMGLPQETDQEKCARAEAIREGYKQATRVPLDTARLCLEAMKLALIAAEDGLPAGVTDAGVAGLVSRAGLEGAIYNVRVNLPEVGDEEWVGKVQSQIDRLLEEAESISRSIRSHVEEELHV
ncbi:MAG TPA: glutamate formimidoyltransferase [Planctomycetes bacterium]|nr:glutamate formimidoyltransferase [Planctomycetota bacterium]